MFAGLTLVHPGHYRVADLYTTEKEGWYWYTYGINFRFGPLKLLVTHVLIFDPPELMQRTSLAF